MHILKKILWGFSLPFVFIYLILKILLAKNKCRKYLKNPSDFLDDERYAIVNHLAKLYLYIKGIHNNYYDEKETKLLSKPQLIIANHRSMLDPILLFVFINQKTNLKPIFVAKKELSESFFSFAFNLIDTIYVDRENLRQMISTIEKQKEVLKEGRILVIFPEGTRNTDDELLEFKSGLFEVAYKTMVPIQPIVMANVEQYMEKKKEYKNKKQIAFTLLEPIQPSNFIQIDRNILAKKTKDEMQKQYNKIK